MIVLDKYEFFYTGAPRTGSVCLHDFFYKLKKGLWPETAIQYPNTLGRHDRRPPEGTPSNYGAVISIRNPYYRAVSYWKHRHIYAGETGDFDEFLDNLLKSKDEAYMNLCDFYQFITPAFQIDIDEKPNEAIHLLSRMVHFNYPYGLKKANYNETGAKELWELYRTQERVEKINAWAAHDFDYFGYKRL